MLVAARLAGFVLGVASILGVAGCAADSPISPSPAAAAPPAGPATGFTLNGDAESANGAAWTYAATSGGTVYDLQGILLKPAGSGPFPAVILSHGAGGSARGISLSLARTMVRWGLVCIATNYTHAGGVAIGSPGTDAEPGASAANIARATKMLDLLRGLGYADMTRVAAHGHSMGAFVTAALVGSVPGAFRAASHTAGGVRPGALYAAPAPVLEQVTGIRAPYQMHHGDQDGVVSLQADRMLADALLGRGVTSELVVYAGADHDDVAQDAAMLERVREWYRRHGMF